MFSLLSGNKLELKTKKNIEVQYEYEFISLIYRINGISSLHIRGVVLVVQPPPHHWLLFINCMKMVEI
jgi:hypothetical protein